MRSLCCPIRAALIGAALIGAIAVVIAALITSAPGFLRAPAESSVSRTPAPAAETATAAVCSR